MIFGERTRGEKMKTTAPGSHTCGTGKSEGKGRRHGGEDEERGRRLRKVWGKKEE